MWIEERISTTAQQPVGEREDNSDHGDSDSDSQAEHTTTSNFNFLDNTTTTSSLSESSVALYTVAKTAPFRQITVDRIISDFGATDFLETLCSFLRKHIPACKISPHAFDRFDVYKQITISLPHN